jgi:multidrug efflux pump subunit AcrA (membrane-fusion protein)
VNTRTEPKPSTGRPRARPNRWVLASAILGAALASVGAAAVALDRTRTKPLAAPQALATRRTLRSQIQATGIVRAMVGAEVKVGTRVSGKVEQLLANVGDRVEKGTVIARIEDGDLRARVRRAEADRDAAQAQLALVRRGARAEEIAEGEAGVRQAEADRAMAEADLGRKSVLAEQGYASDDDADRSRRDRDVASAKLDAARSRLGLLRQRYLPEDVALARARLEQAEATLVEARSNLSYATITAPISGVVAQVTTEAGETVAAGMNAPTFVTLIDLDRLEVAAYVDEVDVGRVRPGQSATFTVDSFPDVEFNGTVTAVYPRAVVQSNVVNYITTISVADSRGRLKPDMTVTATIVLDERDQVLTVPDQALRREGGKRVVLRVEDGRPQPREVKVGMRGGGHTEIVSGIREGDVVLVGDMHPSKEEP